MIRRARDRSFAGTWAARSSRSGGEIEAALACSDPELGALIGRVVERAGRQRYPVSNARSHFDALVRSIVYQQLSKKAAATIYARFLDAVAGEPAPARVLAVSDACLRPAGLSRPKIRYVKALAQAVVLRQLDLDQLESLPDQEVIDRLVAVPGIGVWTAQMFLMFRLRRPDVLPMQDLGIRHGVQLAHGLKRPAAPRYIERVGNKWAPHRSLACLYLWAAIDLGR